MENQLQKIQIEEETNTDGLVLNPIEVNEDYLKEWNCSTSGFRGGFKCLTYNGKLVSNTLYRVGGMGKSDLSKGRYFLLLKYIEDCYSDIVTTDPNRKKHLASHSCIIDKYGNEKVVVENKFDYIYLVGKDSVIYSIDNSYYNIETGEFYCQSYDRMESEEFIFLNNAYDDDKSRRGIMKIDKITGEFELFKKE